MVPLKIARRFSRSIQDDSEQLRRRIVLAQRAARTRATWHNPTERRAILVTVENPERLARALERRESDGGS